MSYTLSYTLSYRQAVAELESLGIMPVGLPELGPMRRALERSGLTGRIDPARNAVIAGTNGKGTTSAALARLLHSADKRTGLYTSPHLVTTRERIRVADEDVSEELFVATYLALRDLIRVERLTHFEALTLMATHIFYSGELVPPVDWAVWEVGLGGKFDATNAIPHRYCAITRLGLDHQAILGSTLAEIAEQKFGIIGPAAPVVYSPMDPSLEALRDRIRLETHCRWIPARQEAWGKIESPLPGARAAENLSTALTLFETLGFDPSRHLQSLAGLRWPGRFSQVSLPGFACPLYASGDHNLQGVESLLEILRGMTWKELHLIVGIGRDKKAGRMLELLSEIPRATLYLTETPFKGLAIEEYPKRFADRAALRVRDPRSLVSAVGARAREGDLVLVTGSLYLVGEVLTA